MRMRNSAFKNFKSILVERNSMCEYDLDFMESSAKMKDRDYGISEERFSKNEPVYFAKQNESYVDPEYLDYLKNL